MPEATPVIDMWAPIVPSREIVAHIRDHFPPAMNGYLRTFFKQEPSPETFRVMADAMLQEDEVILRRLDEAGIDRALITGFDETSTAGSAFVTNEAVGATRGTLDVIDLASGARVASVALRLQPGGIGFWKIEAPRTRSAEKEATQN